MHSFQRTTSTAFNRYSAAYDMMGQVFPREAGLNILVFGGSYGWEAAALHVRFPAARILSVDVSDAALTTARATFAGNPALRFARSDWALIAAEGPYDLILCHSVFCDIPGSYDKWSFDAFAFWRFDQAMGSLVNALAPEGVISVINSSYPFGQTDAAQGLVKLDRALHLTIPMFERGGVKIAQVTMFDGFPILQGHPGTEPDAVREYVTGALWSRKARDLPRTAPLYRILPHMVGIDTARAYPLQTWRRIATCIEVLPMGPAGETAQVGAILWPGVHEGWSAPSAAA